jgi:hypothetical protein
MAVMARLIKALGLLALCAAQTPTEAAELLLRVERAATAGIVLEALEARIDWPDNRPPHSVDVSIARLRADVPALDIQSLRYACSLSSEGQAASGCDGRLSWRDAQGQGQEARLVLNVSEQSIHASLTLGGSLLTVAWPLHEGEPVLLTAKGVPATWLQGELENLWPGARWMEGTLDGDLALSWNAAGALQVEGRLRGRGLALDTDDGTVAAAGLDVDGSLALSLGTNLTLRTSLALSAGELLFGQFYVELPARPVALALQAVEVAAAQWHLTDIRVEDPAAFTLGGDVRLDLEADDWLVGADLALQVSDASEAVARYASSVLGLAGLGGVRAEGGAEAELRLDRRGLRSLTLEARDLYLADAQGRFAVDRISGPLAIGPESAAREGTLRWDAASFYRIPLGTLELPLRSGGGVIELTSAASVPVLGGSLALQRLRWRQAEDADAEFAASLAVDGLQLADLAAALGWPQFGGLLSGRIPAVRYQDGVLAFDGGFEVGVFDGRVEIDSLSMERPFGVLPTLNADIRLSGLDLQQMTRVFDFGEIEGRLQGHVLGLRLIDWEPVAFDAVLRTEKGAGPRRISQRAVESLSSVGGGGGVAALQTSVLRVFNTFGYDEIGLSCRLQNHVCHMDGVDSVGQGYAIVKGSGLPRISVVGHQRQVDWPVLLARLQAATTGAGPVMN